MRRETTILLLIVMTLVLIGVLTVFSASSVGKTAEDNSSIFFYFIKQTAYAAIGTVLMFVTARFDYHRLQDPVVFKSLVLFSLTLLVLVLIPGVGDERGGAQRWLVVAGFTFQPSELAKVAVIILLAVKLSQNQQYIRSFVRGFLPPAVSTGLFLVLILAEKDLGAPTVICFVALIMLFMAGAQWAHVLGSITLAVGGLVALVVTVPYRFMRLMSFRDPWQFSQEQGFQLIQSMAAFARGGIWGLGPGASEQKLYYLPDAHTDFIFAVWAEEMGLMGTLTLALLFLVFLLMSYRIAFCAKDMLGSLLAVGISSMITFQAAFNMAVTTGLAPTKGLPLPFISAGGSALIITMAIAGVLINIGLQAEDENKPPVLVLPPRTNPIAST